MDSYVTEGPVEITISYTSITSSTPVIIENKKTLAPAQEGEPTRFLITSPPFSDCVKREFTVVWSNSNWLSQRMIVYSINLVSRLGENGSKRKEAGSPGSNKSTGITPEKLTVSATSVGSLDAPHHLQPSVPLYKVITVEGKVLEPIKPFLWGIFAF